MRYVNEKQPIPEFITNFDEACDFCNYAGERYDQIVKNSISNIKRKYYIETGCQIITEENIFVTIKNKIVKLIQKFIELLKNLFEKFIGFFKKKRKSDESDSSSSSGSSTGSAALAARQSNSNNSGSSTGSAALAARQSNSNNNENNINSVQLVDHPIPKNVFMQPIEKWMISEPTVNAFNGLVSTSFERFKMVSDMCNQLFNKGNNEEATKLQQKIRDHGAIELKAIDKFKSIKGSEEIYNENDENEPIKFGAIPDFINKNLCGDEIPASEVTYGKLRQYYKIIDNNVHSSKAIDIANGIYKKRDAQLKQLKHDIEKLSNTSDINYRDSLKEIAGVISITLKMNQAVFSGILKGIENFSLYAAQLKVAFKRAEKGIDPIRKGSAA